MPYIIQKHHISIEGNDKVVFSGEGATALINSLIQKPAITLVELVSGGSVINLSAISVDDTGRVIITKKEFKEAVEERLKLNTYSAGGKGTDPGFFDTNCSCNV